MPEGACACHVTDMAKRAATKKRTTRNTGRRKAKTTTTQRVGARRWVARGLVGVVALVLLWIAAYSVIRPPTTPYIVKEGLRLGGVERTWVDMHEIAPAMARSAVAAEDADFCLHWGFDMGALRLAIAEGANRGASTITQQTVKNVWLWQGRSWPRKAMEAVMTPLVELFWTKRRVLEVYLNVAEFGEGIFGVEAAALHYFGVPASSLTDWQAALLASVLPDPKGRNASAPSDRLAARARQIADGAATIRADGRANCFAGE